MARREKRPLAPQARLVWARFWARQIDVNICITPLILLEVLLIPAVTKWNSNLLAVLTLPLAMVLCGVEQAAFGQTIGKVIAGLQARRDDGAKLPFILALRRELGVWTSGLGLGLPLVSLFLMTGSADQVRHEGKTRYDQTLNTDVFDQGSNAARTWITFVFSIVIIAGLYALSYGVAYAVGQARQPSVEAVLAQQAASTRATLPKKLDNITTWTDMKASAKTLTYVYQLSTQASNDQFEAVVPQLRGNVARGYCSQGLSGLGVTSVYDYFAGARHLGQFILTPADCAK